MYNVCNGGSHHDDITHARVVKHWGNVMEQIARLTDSSHNSAIHNCVQMALSSGPFRFSIKDGHEDHLKIQSEIQKHISLHNAFSTIDPGGSYDIITAKCIRVLFDVLTSHNFASLCDLLCETFQCANAKVILDFCSVISKLANGVYKHSFELFDKDIQLVWENFRKIGQEITLFACNSSNISQISCQEKNMDCNTASIFTDQMTVLSVETKKNNSSGLDMISTCKQCSTETCGKSSLICDRCEFVFHVKCINPPIQNIPTGIWYCSVCENKGKPSKLISSVDNPDCKHQNCVVCNRLEELGCFLQKENPQVYSESGSNSKECTVSCLEDKEFLEPSRTATLRLCRKCGDCEDEEKKFLICSNSGCLYKYYHIHCLNNSHLASKHQPVNCWYCPSCLCRACLIDKDDELICMCDGCDEGYHIYCMKPPRAAIPEGKWYCNTCKLEKIRKGMQIYENSVLQKHGQNGSRSSSGANRSINVLVPTPKKLKTEESVEKKKQR